MEKVVEIKDIEKTYYLGKTEIKALQGINLQIKNKGKFICICGPSGSGKTTLLNLIGCLDRPTRGDITVLDMQVLALSDTKLSELRNRHIGFIFQTFNLIPVLSAYENVEYPLLIQGVSGRERKKRVLQMLEEVRLIEFKNHRPDELSGGQRQRVSIARALVTLPEIVLADEPTANLDTMTGEAILELMRKISKEHLITFIFSTHDHKILNYAEKIYYLRDGKISLKEG
ncbi:MAG: ABC transporter ATP-binding protein [Candidatus Helarchaeota archaeon]|nr:ABC transporter ATP-binding protein [Candidatus Helarchaeota archaeon]